MNVLHKKEYYLRTSDFDCNSRLRPAAILDLFQDAAGVHAEELGVGFDAMREKQMIWVVARVKYQVLKTPDLHSTVLVKTWPLPPSRVAFLRNYQIEDLDGTVLVNGISEWVVMHSEKRRLVSASNVYPFTDGFCMDKTFEEKLTRIPDFEDDSTVFGIIPGFSDLDVNGHVNNTKYANYVIDAVSEILDRPIDVFQLDYHHEVLLGTKLSICKSIYGDTVCTKGKNENGETMFTCRFTLK